MNNKILLLVSLIFLLIVLLGGGEVTAQSSGFGTPEEALEQALSDYMSLVGDEGLWELGEIFEDGSFAYSIAKHKELSGVEEGNVLILARLQNNLWNARTPEKDKPEDYNSWLAEFPDSLLSEFDKSYFYLYTQEDFSFLDSISFMFPGTRYIDVSLFTKTKSVFVEYLIQRSQSSSSSRSSSNPPLSS